MKSIKSAFCLLTAIVIAGNIFVHEAHAAPGLLLSGDQQMTITNDKTIVGGIELKDNAILTIRNAIVRVEHSQDNPRAEINVNGHAKLIIENSALIPPQENPDNLYLTAFDDSSIDIQNGTFINVINLVGRAKITGVHAKIYSSTDPLNIPEDAGAFGIVQLAQDTSATFTDSVVGSFALFFDEGDHIDLAGLAPKKYADFDLKRDAVKFSPRFNIVLKNTEVLPVRLHGPFERSWAIFTQPGADVTIRNSSLNKLVIQGLDNGTFTFSDLRLGQPQSFDYQNIHLQNSTIANEWGFSGTNSSFTFTNSEGLWPWPIGTGVWRFDNSKIIEFDPRDFKGTFVFNTSKWANAGEIFEGTDMKIEGSYQTSEDIDKHLAMSNSRITREFPLEVRDSKGKITEDYTIQGVQGKKISMAFDDTTYHRSQQFVIQSAQASRSVSVNLFSETPIKISFEEKAKKQSSPPQKQITEPNSVKTQVQKSQPAPINIENNAEQPSSLANTQIPESQPIHQQSFWERFWSGIKHFFYKFVLVQKPIK